VLEALVGRSGVVAEHAGDEPRDRVDDGQTSDLATGQHEVTEADLQRVQQRHDPLIVAFIVAADEQEAFVARKFAGQRLGKRTALRGQENPQGRSGISGFDGRNGVANRLGQAEHAGAAAEGAVIHGLVLVVAGVVAELVGVELNEAGGLRAPEDARREIRLHHLREQR